MTGRMVAALVALLGYLAPVAVRADTAVAPGDVLDVNVVGEPTLTQQVTVARDGSITFPMVGRLVVKGLSTTAVAHEVTTRLNRYIRQPIVAVAIHTEAQYNVLILGNVKTPGRYTVQPGSKLSDAVAAAGGLGPVSGKFPDARVALRDGVRSVSLEALLRHGDVTQDVALSDGAAVYVTAPTTIRVRVLGAVDHPGDVEVNEGDRLAVAVAKAGNSANANADLNRIRVMHTEPGKAPTTTEVDLYKVLRNGDFSHDVILASDDVIFVPQTAKRDGGTAQLLLGAVRRLFWPF